MLNWPITTHILISDLLRQPSMDFQDCPIGYAKLWPPLAISKVLGLGPTPHWYRIPLSPRAFPFLFILNCCIAIRLKSFLVDVCMLAHSQSRITLSRPATENTFAIPVPNNNHPAMSVRHTTNCAPHHCFTITSGQWR